MKNIELGTIHCSTYYVLYFNTQCIIFFYKNSNTNILIIFISIMKQKNANNFLESFITQIIIIN